METTKQPLNVVIQSVIEANNPYAGTMYTKEDVLRILNTIEVEKATLTSEQIGNLQRKVRRSIEDCSGDEVIDFSSLTFDIRNGNEIEATDGDIKYETLTEASDCAIDDFFNELNDVNSKLVRTSNN